MVLYCFRWNIHPDKTEAYAAWARGAIQRTLAAGGVTEFRGYRQASGSAEVGRDLRVRRHGGLGGLGRTTPDYHPSHNLREATCQNGLKAT